MSEVAPQLLSDYEQRVYKQTVELWQLYLCSSRYHQPGSYEDLTTEIEGFVMEELKLSESRAQELTFLSFIEASLDNVRETGEEEGN